MAHYITLDGGTSTTRISLCKDFKIMGTKKLAIGVRSAIDNKPLLEEKIKAGITELLAENSITEEDVHRIFASGMISSEFGLCPLEHATIPISIYELKNTAREICIDKISSIPFVFVRGIKKLAKNPLECDVIRGEETEIAGIFDTRYGGSVYILPGSHSKVVRVNSQGIITDFSTLMTGEMIFALSESTILKDAVDLSCDEISDEYLLLGYRYANEVGINKALFKARILKNLHGISKNKVYSYFIGVVICDEIREILKYDEDTVIIGGKSQLKVATGKILQAVSNKRVVVLSDKEVDESVSRGLLKIFVS